MRNGKYLILCVDDDGDIRDSLRIVLESGGYEVETASSGEEALGLYRRTAPDLVLCDLMMEEIDAGTHLAKELKAAGNTAPVLMLSSVGDQLNTHTDFGGLGLAGVLQKPVDSHTLLRLVGAKLASPAGA